MATDKNTKSKASGDGSRVRSRHSGLMALESRVLFSAAPLMADLPGLESANYGAAAIEAALLPGDKLGADLGQINGLVPTPPGEAENQAPGLVPTPEKHLTHHQSKGTHLNQFAPKKHTHLIINMESMRTAGLMDPQDCPSVIETLPAGDGVAPRSDEPGPRQERSRRQR